MLLALISQFRHLYLSISPFLLIHSPFSILNLFSFSLSLFVKKIYLTISLNSFSILNSQFILFLSFSLSLFVKKNLSHYLAKFILNSQFSIFNLISFSLSLFVKNLSVYSVFSVAKNNHLSISPSR